MPPLRSGSGFNRLEKCPDGHIWGGAEKDENFKLIKFIKFIEIFFEIYKN